MALRSLSLCAGVGGIDLGLHEWCRTVGYVEREAFAAACLVARMEDAALDPAPVWDDLTTFDGRAWRGGVDLISAGYPCQPFSVAGKRAGENDPRHLWPHVARIIREVEPALVFLENVPGHVSLGLPEVLAEVSAMGFDAEWGCFRASEVGAPHRRERLFVLAYRDEHGREELRRCGVLDGERTTLGDDADGRGEALADAEGEPWSRLSLGAESALTEPRERIGEGMGDADLSREDALAAPSRERDPVGKSGEHMGDSERPRLEGRHGPSRSWTALGLAWPPGPQDRDGWSRWIERGGAQPVIRRGVDGLSAFVDRSDRLRCLGNAVVPAQARAAFRELSRRILCP